MSELRTLVIAESFLARTGLTTLLAEQTEFNIVGQVSGGELLADDIDAYRPDVLVWDFGWEPQTALTRLTDLSDELGTDSLLPVLILLADEQQAGAIASILREWPAGGILRDAASDQLIAAINAIAQGLLVFDPTLDIVPTTQDIPEQPVENLTPREQEVLQLLAEGLANKMIAQQLSISDHTVKFHVNAIMTKLNAQSRTEAVVRATRLGLIML